jgi:uncharacterized membrane protein
MNNEKQARKLLGSWLRQSSGGTLPLEVPLTPALAKLVEQATAQKIWTELLATWPGRKQGK